jgi:type IV pilus assembly protein PilN
MIRIDINLSSRPFVNYRKFYLITGSLLGLLFLASFWNWSQYRSSHERREAFVQSLSNDRLKLDAMGREQEKLLRSLQTSETAEFLDRVEYVNQLINRRTFSWTQLLNDLEKLTPPNLQLASIKPQVRGSDLVIEIVVKGRVTQDMIQFVSNLENSGKFADVSPIYEDLSKNPSFVGRELGVIVKYLGQTKKQS